MCVISMCVCTYFLRVCFLTRSSAKRLQGVLVQCAVCAVFCVLCVLWCVLDVLCAVRCVLCAVCFVLCPALWGVLCNVLCVLCCALCACSCHRRVLFSCGFGGAHTTTLSLKIQEDLERIESSIKSSGIGRVLVNKLGQNVEPHACSSAGWVCKSCQYIGRAIGYRQWRLTCVLNLDPQTFFTLLKTPLTAPLPFEHLVDFFEGLGGNFTLP